MPDLPENLLRGEVARLFPVIAETGKEQRAASIFLSVLSAVPPYADAIFSQLGQRVGTRTTVDTFTEVVFKNETDATKKDRPDGLIILSSGKNKNWKCLVETKIGKNDLDHDQVERYIKLAKDNGVDAVLTISNEFASIPTHHPIAHLTKKTKKVELFHLSWSSLLTEAITLHEKAAVSDPEQAFLIREFVRFFSHPSAGVAGVTSMPPEWASAIDRIQAGGTITKADGQKIVGTWHQKVKDLSLQMSQMIGCKVETKLSRKHVSDPESRLADETEQLCSKSILTASLVVPDAAAPIEICADLTGRLIRVFMQIDAPRDKARNSSRLTWLLRQLRDKELADAYVGVVWASRASTNVFKHSELRDNPNLVNDVNQNSEIRAFDITVTTANARRFSGVRTFIEELEMIAPKFYEDIGQHLSNWQPSPPKPKHSVKSEGDSEGASDSKPGSSNEQPKAASSAGNEHTALLEIPAFLLRASEAGQ